MGIEATRRIKVKSPVAGVRDDDQLRLISCDGMHWSGEMHWLVPALLRGVIERHYADELSELWVAVILRGEYDPVTHDDRYEQLDGNLRAITEDALIFLDGATAPLDDIVSVQI